MKWQVFLIILAPLIALANANKTIKINYVAITNDVEFYSNQPVTLRLSVCDNRERLCTELDKSETFTYTAKNKALKILLSAEINGKKLNALLAKRKIHWEGAKIKIEVTYARSDVFTKFSQGIMLYKDLINKKSEVSDIVLRDYINEESGIVEVSHLQFKQND